MCLVISCYALCSPLDTFPHLLWSQTAVESPSTSLIRCNSVLSSLALQPILSSHSSIPCSVLVDCLGVCVCVCICFCLFVFAFVESREEMGDCCSILTNHSVLCNMFPTSSRTLFLKYKSNHVASAIKNISIPKALS